MKLTNILLGAITLLLSVQTFISTSIYVDYSYAKQEVSEFVDETNKKIDLIKDLYGKQIETVKSEIVEELSKIQ